MKKIALTLFGLPLSICCAAAADELTVSAPVVYGGICEPSGAVLLPNGKYLVANDEDNNLRVYDSTSPGQPVISSDVSQDLGLDPNDDDDDIDFEGATWLNGKVYFIGSHGRSTKGNWRPARAHLIAVVPKIDGDTPEIGKPVGQFDGLLPALEGLDDALKAAIGPHGTKVEELAPEKQGLNIEGLTAAADATSLILGMRNPLTGDKAWIVRLADVESAIGGQQPSVEKLAQLDLGGRGVRSIEYSPDRESYIIAAGPNGSADGGKTFTLYSWKEGEASATEIAGAADAFAAIAPRFSPEVVIVDDAGKTLHILSDDGDICDSASPTFRSVDITLN